jgi:hypothetical protein
VLIQFLDCPIESGNDRYDRSWAILALEVQIKDLFEATAEKEMKDISWWGSGGVPSFSHNYPLVIASGAKQSQD